MYVTNNPEVPCKLWDADIWFSKEGTKKTALAKKLCSTCPEQAQCLMSAVEYEKRQGRASLGVYGAMTPKGRSKRFKYKGAILF